MAVNKPIEALTVQVTKTADGEHEYLQILSADQFSINIVLIADRIEVRDGRRS
jgi:hypothetical protein